MMMRSLFRPLRVSALAFALGGLLIFGPAHAITITGQLTGDIRPENPDGLFVDVTITFADSNATQAFWTIDLNSPTHPNVKLDQFYFNLTGGAADYSFSNFGPAGWDVESPGSPISGAGAGQASFMFKALDPAAPPNAADVTNSQDLTFTMVFAGPGYITPTMFLDAPSTQTAAGTGQMGAHLQSLTVPAGADLSDSGFAVGDYNREGVPPPIPEPGTMILLGSGLLGLGGILRRRKK